MLLPLLLAALAPSLPGRAWAPSSSGPEEEEEERAAAAAAPTTVAPLRNASAAAEPPFFPAATLGPAEFLEGRKPGPPTAAAAAASPPPPPSSFPREEPFLPCNISVQRQMLSSLLVRWGPWGFQAQCDLVLFATGAGGGGGGGGGGVRSVFSAAFPRVGPPPLLIEPVGLAAGGVQQELRLCVGCSWARGGRRAGRLRPGPAPQSPQPPSPSALFPSDPGAGPPPAPAPAPPVHHHHHHHHPPWQQQGERLHFCCLDFSLEELNGDPGWRMNRKPVESTLVACFMTLVIIVWSVAALIWPVPIIAGFLPNGMEQRRGANAAAAAAAANAASGAGGATK